MNTKDLSIFTKMVNVAKEQNLEYRILHSYSHRNTTSNLTESYKLILCTNLFTVTFSGNFEPSNTSAIQRFLEANSDVCVKLDFDIRINTENEVELVNFR